MDSVSRKPLGQPWYVNMVRFMPYILTGIVLILLPPFSPLFVQSLVTKVIIFAIFAMSLDLIWGYTGLISLGHAAYFGIGGYAVGILTLHYGIDSLWVSAPLGVLSAGILAALFGIIALRVSGAYFLLITVALGELTFSLAWKIKWLSSPGTQGIVGLSYPSLGLPWRIWSPITFYYFVLFLFIVCFLVLYRIIKSPFGYSLQGIHEDVSRMDVLGYNTWLHKYMAFIIAALFAGLAGVLFAYHNGIVVPEDFSVGTSVLPLLVIIIGGVRTLYGAFIGAIIMIPLEFYIGIVIPEHWPLVLGGIFVLSIMFFRDGVGGYLFRFWQRFVPRWMH